MTVSENIIKNIRLNKQQHDTYISPNYYLLNQPHRVFPNISFKNTSPKEIENIIKSLKAKESYGYGGITTEILKINLETNNILAAEQFGFRTSSSTEQASFNFINNILNEFQKKKPEVFSLTYKKPSIA